MTTLELFLHTYLESNKALTDIEDFTQNIIHWRQVKWESEADLIDLCEGRGINYCLACLRPLPYSIAEPIITFRCNKSGCLGSSKAFINFIDVACNLKTSLQLPYSADTILSMLGVVIQKSKKS